MKLLLLTQVYVFSSHCPKTCMCEWCLYVCPVMDWGPVQGVFPTFALCVLQIVTTAKPLRYKAGWIMDGWILCSLIIAEINLLCVIYL